MRALKRRQREVFWVLAGLAAIVMASVYVFQGAAKAEVAASGAAGAAKLCQVDEAGRLGEGVTRAWCSIELREIAPRSPQGDEVALEARIAQNALQRQARDPALHAELVTRTATRALYPRA